MHLYDGDIREYYRLNEERWQREEEKRKTREMIIEHNRWVEEKKRKKKKESKYTFYGLLDCLWTPFVVITIIFCIFVCILPFLLYLITP